MATSNTLSVSQSLVGGKLKLSLSSIDWSGNNNSLSFRLTFDSSRYSYDTWNTGGSGSYSTSISLSDNGSTGVLNFSSSINNFGDNSDFLSLIFTPTSKKGAFAYDFTSIALNSLARTNVSGSFINNAVPTGEVLIAGDAKQGSVLTASNTLADADGLGPITYQWKANDVNLVAATNSTLTLDQTQVGKLISVVAAYSDGGGFAEKISSSTTLAVANVNDIPVGAVNISGVATQGQTLTATNTLSDLDGLGTIAYQWQADGVSISGATNATFVLGQAQVGKVIAVTAKYTDAGGTAESVISSASSAVANVNDAPTGAVTIKGTAKVGQTLRAANTISDADGLGTLSYQWKANESTISGATSDTLALTNDLVGKTLSVLVNYTDLGGANESVASIATSSVLSSVAGASTPSLLGQAYQWKTHTLLSGVDVTVGQQVSVTNTEGKYQINPTSTGALNIGVTKEMTSLETGGAITSADALAALKIAVGRSPNADGSPALPYQIIAADVNQDGKVTSADALAILKMAVKRADAPAREWLFVNESQDFWDESANSGQGGYTISRTNVAWNKDVQANVTQDTTVNILAVLKGDVNGSWTGPSTGTQSLPNSYFSELVSKGLGPLSTWGVVAA
jgi:hypothetical protein